LKIICADSEFGTNEIAAHRFGIYGDESDLQQLCLEPVRERYGAREIPETPMARDYMDADGLEGVPFGLLIRKATKRQVFVR
jgi:hypothetical protein